MIENTKYKHINTNNAMHNEIGPERQNRKVEKMDICISSSFNLLNRVNNTIQKYRE